MRRLASAVMVAGFVLLAVGFASGHLSLVKTHGDSMAPRIATGDLVVVRQATYQVGDVVAYHSEELRHVVLHRLAAVRGDRFLFQGDNNDFVDPEEPAIGQLVGKELLHIPQGGLWLDRLTSPMALALATFGLIAAGGTTAHTRLRRRRRTVSQHVAPGRQPRRPMAAMPASARQAAAWAALIAVAGAALGVVAWTKPTTTMPGTPQADPGQSMTFSYSAKVPRSPAYDDTTVTAPDPVFRKLTDTVEVDYSYRGDPGTIAVAAELATASGWHSTVPLAASGRFAEDSYTGTVVLDLADLEARANAAARVTGLPASQVDVSIVPTVTTADDRHFAPELPLALTPLQLTLPGGEPSLTVDAGSARGQEAPQAAVLSVAGRDLPVSTGRILSLVMVLGALLAAAMLGLRARRSATAGEADLIRHRYARMLVEVQPMAAPGGGPVIDVVDFETLARLAQRYELMVLHWTRHQVETFIVQDQATAYRYRTGGGVSLLSTDAAVESA